MNILSLSGALFLSMSAPSPAMDQTADTALLLTFLDALKRGAETEAKSMVSPNAFIGDYAQRKSTSFSEFAEYARTCPLRRVSIPVVRDGSRMPIGVEWLCPYPEGDRNASFWFDGDRIGRIGWGKPPVVKMPPVKSR